MSGILVIWISQLANQAIKQIKRRHRPKSQEQLLKSEDSQKDELGEDHPITLKSKSEVTVLYKEQALYDIAEPLFLKVVEGRRLILGDTHPHTIESWNNLIDLYKAWNKPEKANQWRAKLPQEN